MGNYLKSFGRKSIVDNSTQTYLTPDISDTLNLDIEQIPLKNVFDSDASNFLVRTYENGKTTKQNAKQSVFKLVAVYKYKHKTDTYVSFDKSRGYTLKNSLVHTENNEFVFGINFLVSDIPYDVPCNNTKYSQKLNSYIMYFKCDKEKLTSDKVLCDFFTNNKITDKTRNDLFKLIPIVIEGNMMVKMATKDVPCLIGNKLLTQYVLDDNYLEINLNLTSSSLAVNILGLVFAFSDNTIMDLGFCLRNDKSDDFLCGCRFDKVSVL